jgi:hypothetical protein
MKIGRAISSKETIVLLKEMLLTTSLKANLAVGICT